ncbi:MAG: hypothetical protein HYS13_20395 [Planctomycetia bacterium]|nr:hypothetical protein [Planctomycetia bacterium]
MIYRGQIKNGHIVLDDAAVLPEGAQVQVEVVASQSAPEVAGEAPTLFERLKPVVGAAKGLPPDASENVDHYLYGHPKQ